MKKFPEKYTTETLKEAIHKKHPNIELVSEYNGDNDSEITVKCSIDGNVWKTTPHHLSQQKYGCSKCYHRERKKALAIVQDEKFRNFLIKNYEPFYDISQVEYISNKIKVKLICPIHGEFKLRPDKMVNRLDGCPYCNESHLERQTRLILDRLGIKYEREKTFDWLYNKIKMPMDFYLLEYNISIECQGEQHVVERDDSLMNKNDKFEDKIFRDKLKNRLCKENNLPIIYIFNKMHSSNRLNEIFEHIYDDSLFIEDINNDNNILLKEIKKKGNKIN